MYYENTIAAVATPAGEGAIGVVRLSGDRAAEIADRVFFADDKKPLVSARGYTVRLGRVRDADGRIIDRAIALVFRAPKSYTGEDVVEIQCHGGEIVLERTLRRLLDEGAEPAAAGEFTRRAFENGKMSLTEAEAVAELISASSRQGEAAAASLVDGELHRRTLEIKQQLIVIQSAIAAGIDFPEEDVEEVDTAELSTELANICSVLKRLVDSYESGRAVLRGIPVTIVGSPNVGKSTLMNLMSGYERAIVAPIAGTTRDVLEQRVRLAGLTLILSDTAGIHDSSDIIEQEGVSRAIKSMEQSALILAVFDNSRELSGDDKKLIERLKDRQTVAIVNKTDLDDKLDRRFIEDSFGNVVYISAMNPDSLPLLEQAIKEQSGAAKLSPDEPVLATERQRRCTAAAAVAVKNALDALRDNAFDAAYASISEAIESLCELDGENPVEAVLDEVFSRFCVGK